MYAYLTPTFNVFKLQLLGAYRFIDEAADEIGYCVNQYTAQDFLHVLPLHAGQRKQTEPYLL